MCIFIMFVRREMCIISVFIKRDSFGAINFTYFRPYEKGFVGIYGDPSNYLRERINEGSFESPEKELIYDQAIPTQACPGMVGPFSDGNYFCTAKEYGYCDRRSGICFCNIGYQGIDCSECTPSYFMIGNLCYPKKLCPNDCSNSGVCNYITGTCECVTGREGSDCSLLLCKTIDELCEACSSTLNKCLRCQAGYYLSQTGSCQSCYDFDPRCAGCTLDEGCTLCSDPVLTSVRRSGYRFQDPPLPIEEDTREFSITLPFGTKSPESFADAEAYLVVSTNDKPLNNNTKTCDQGYNNDDTWICKHKVATHLVCGHKGVFSFTYPNYIINETSRFFRIAVVRTGGGYGTVNISYFIKHITTNDNDLTATAPYTTSQTLVFSEGIVERTFLISILDDNIVEDNEVFQIILELPEGGGSLGAQFRTNVTIIDDDYKRLSAIFTKSIWDNIIVSANNMFSFLIQGKLANGNIALLGGERFSVVIENNLKIWQINNQRHSKRYFCQVYDNGNGTYTVQGKILNQGNYKINIYHAFPGGLLGTYYNDAFMENIALQRIDRYVNFTWGTGRLIPRGADYISIRWTGVIRPDTTETYLFHIDADDHARLWIDGILLIDHWHEQRVDLEPFRSIDLIAYSFYEIILEYREVRLEAHARLLWTTLQTYNDLNKIGKSGINSFQAIPPENMYSLYEIGNSPINLIVTSSDTSPLNTECNGDGLISGIVGIKSYFQFCPKDKYWNYRDDIDDFFLSSELFSSIMILIDDKGHQGDGKTILHPILTYDYNIHCFNGEYIPDRAGLYNLSITYQTWHNETYQHVAGSPFYVTIEPGIFSGPNSNILDIPHPFQTIAGNCYNFTIIARDQFNNLLLKGNNTIEVYMYRVSFFYDNNQESISTEYYDSTKELVRYGTIIDHNNGKYTVTICPITTGWYEVHILYNGFGISNIPYEIQNKQYSEGIATGLNIGSSYRGQYISQSPYHMYTQHNSYISPYHSTIEVYGNLLGGKVGLISSCIITLRDNWNNVIRTLNLPYPTIKANLLLSPEVTSSISFLGNGSVYIEYIPIKTGDNIIEILINNFPIYGSPFTVYISEGDVSEKYTYAIGNGLHYGIINQISSFLLYSYDINGNRKYTSNDIYQFQTNGTEIIINNLNSCKLNDNDSLYESPQNNLYRKQICGNDYNIGGVYYGMYIPTKTGELNITINLIIENNNNNNDDNGNGNGNTIIFNEISNSPFIASIHPGLPVAENSDVLGALDNIIVGELNYIYVSLRDKYNNLLESGNNILELVLYGVSGNWGTEQPLKSLYWLPNMYHYSGFYNGIYPTIYGNWIDNLNGRYIGSYILNLTGVYVMRISLIENGLNVTYFNDTTFGYLSILDDNLQSFINNNYGNDVNLGSTISWTGDIGGKPNNNDGSIGEGSYFHRFKTRVESNIYFDSRDIESYLIWNKTNSSNNNNKRSYILENTQFETKEKFRESYWSVRYMGVIKPEYSEIYNFTIEADAGSRVILRIGGNGINTNMSNLGNIIVQLNNNTEVASGQYNFLEIKYYEFLLEYQHYSSTDTYLHLYWESPSTKRTIIPSSAFGHWRNISHYNITANPTKLSSITSTAYGNSLNNGIVGKKHSFLVYGRDIYGNLLQHGNDKPTMFAVGSNGITFRGNVTDYGNSTYLIEYYPTLSGIYQMYVTIGCCIPNSIVGISREIELTQSLLIKDSPFLLIIEPSNIEPSRCIAIGNNLINGIVGELNSFTILFRDLYNNPTIVPLNESLNIIFYIKSINSNDIIINHVNKNEWFKRTLYNVTIFYNITQINNYYLHVLINNIPILHSPFLLTMTTFKSSNNNIQIHGNGKYYSYINQQTSFEIILYDKYNNKINYHNQLFYIRLIGTNHIIGKNNNETLKYSSNLVSNLIINKHVNFNSQIIPYCKENINKNYLCNYQIDYSGNYLLYISLITHSNYNPKNSLRMTIYTSIYLNLNEIYQRNVNNNEYFLLEKIVSEINFVFNNGFKIYTDNNTLLGKDILEGKDFGAGLTIIWDGFLTVPYSDIYVIKMNSINWNSSVYLDSELIYDTSTIGLNISNNGVYLQENSVYSIHIESIATSEQLLMNKSILQLIWSTTSTRETIIPSFYLYDSIEDIEYSPFPVTVHNNI